MLAVLILQCFKLIIFLTFQLLELENKAFSVFIELLVQFYHQFLKLIDFIHIFTKFLMNFVAIDFLLSNDLVFFLELLDKLLLLFLVLCLSFQMHLDLISKPFDSFLHQRCVFVSRSAFFL